MTRLWLVVVEDPSDETDDEYGIAAYIASLIDSQTSGLHVRGVRRGGLLARKVLDELPPMRRGEGDRSHRPARLAP